MQRLKQTETVDSICGAELFSLSRHSATATVTMPNIQQGTISFSLTATAAQTLSDNLRQKRRKPDTGAERPAARCFLTNLKLLT